MERYDGIVRIKFAGKQKLDFFRIENGLEPLHFLAQVTFHGLIVFFDRQIQHFLQRFRLRKKARVRVVGLFCLRRFL